MKISVVGAYGVGRTYRVERMPDAGETVLALDSDDSHGGKGSNQAVAAARLGAQVSLFTAIGDDAAGRGARTLWRDEGVVDDFVVTRPGPTMTGVIAVEPTGENRIIVSPGVLAALEPSDLDAFRQAIVASDLLVVSLEIPVDVAFRAIEMARKAGVRTLLNPAPATGIPVDRLAGIDILTPNSSEAIALTRSPDPAAAATELARRTGGVVVLTRGADSVLIASADGRVESVAAHRALRVVDTTGAGDSFTAALGVALSGGASVWAAASWAAAAGAYTVQAEGVIPALPRTDRLPPLSIDDGTPSGEDNS